MSEEEKIEEQPKDNPPPQTENNSNASEPAIINEQPSIAIMEVHKHPHHVAHKKKWGEYLLEFFMLFLAVFLGFVAENIREEVVENHREKQFMHSLVEDLGTDTAELLKAKQKADTVTNYSDSVLIFLRTYKISKEIPIQLANFVGKAALRQTLINTDRTSSQLKNSGAMRLIRNNKVSNLIVRYWKQIDETNISLDRYMLYRDASRALVFKLWLIPEVYASGLLMKRDTIQKLRVIDPDSKKWDEFRNLIGISGTITKNVHIKNLDQQLMLARELIKIIKKEYHLDNE